jgi:hypothetical protein
MTTKRRASRQTIRAIGVEGPGASGLRGPEGQRCKKAIYELVKEKRSNKGHEQFAKECTRR